MGLNTNRHSVYELKYHLVVVTKYRKKVINDTITKELYEIAKNIIEINNNGKLIEFNSDLDHVHLLFSVGPQVQLSKLINSYKTVSSRLIRKNHNDYLKNICCKSMFWSNSYYIGSVGNTNEKVIKNYILNQ